MSAIEKLRLITLPHFESDLQTLLPDSLHEFASRCVSFENHYLQSPDWFECLAEDVPTEWDADVLPELEDRFQWLHAATADVEAVFSGLKSSLSGGTNDVTTVVTVQRGCDIDLQKPFSSLLVESRIRVPLWIWLPSGTAGSIQTLTGSDDLIATINRFLGDSLSGEDTFDVLELAATPGVLHERQLRIRAVDAEAIRTDSFLFARSLQKDEATGERSSALYSKPDDLWNIHDVSGEYPQTVDELSAVLDAAW